MPNDDTHSAVTLTDANFETEIQRFEGVALVDFWAAWCGPCLMMAPKVEELARKLKDNPKVKVAKLDVDQNLNVSNALGIMSLPTFKFFVNGEIVDEQIGAIPGPVLEQKLMQIIEQAK